MGSTYSEIAVVDVQAMGHDQRQACCCRPLAACVGDAYLTPPAVRFDVISGSGGENCNAKAIHDLHNIRYLPLAGLLNFQKLLNCRQGYARIRVGFERTQWD